MKSLWITAAVALLALTAVPQAFAYTHHRMMHHRMMHHHMMYRHGMMMHHHM